MLDLAQFQQLQLHQVISADFLSQSIRQVEKDTETTYFFESDAYSFPHRVVVSPESKIVEVAVHVPKDLGENYLQVMQQLGSPDYSFSLSEYETQNVFVQAGKLFTLDESGAVIMATTAGPERIQSVADKIQVKVEQKVDHFVEIESMLTPTSTSLPVENTRSLGTFSQNLGGLLIVVGLVGMALLLGLYLRWKKLSSSGPVPNQIPPPSIP